MIFFNNLPCDANNSKKNLKVIISNNLKLRNQIMNYKKDKKTTIKFNALT